MSQTQIYARLALPALILSGAVALWQTLDRPAQLQATGQSVTCASLRCSPATSR